MRLVILAAIATLASIPAHAGQPVDYTVNGVAYQGYRAQAAGNAKGLVLIIHDWDGFLGHVGQHIERPAYFVGACFLEHFSLKKSFNG